ncbi:hypothetical protein C8Q76DRAFT_783767 [Earliella scabrosa]|nr:hypothetical protein C8Q76DRAFT_783767 [Earliella scabrosa]
MNEARAKTVEAFNKVMSREDGGRGEQLTVMLGSARPKLEGVVAAVQRYPSDEVNKVLENIEGIQRNLDKQGELAKIVLSDTKEKLETEIGAYLSAIRKARDNASPENQLARRNAHQRIVSASAKWKERARLLEYEYARKAK